MTNDLIKLPHMPFDSDADADSLRVMATELHGELNGCRPRGRNFERRLMFVLRVLSKSQALSSARASRLTWRERFTGRVSQ